MKNRLLTTVGVVTLLLLAEGAWVYAFLPRPADATRNSAGTVSLATSPVVSNQVIGSALWNNTFGGLRQDVEDSLDRSGRGGMLAALRGVDGTVGAPALSFTSETGTGLYRIGAGNIGVALLGTKVGEWTANGYRSANGAVATPSLSFFNDTGAGLYRIGSNDFGFAVNGVKTQEWTTTGTAITGTTSSTGIFLAADGTVSAPGYSFTSENDGSGGGLYRAAAQDIRLSDNGADIQRWTPTGSSITGDMSVSGIVTGAEYLCSSYGASATRCGAVSANGSGDATVTIAASMHACICSDATVTTPAATGCNLSGTTLTVKTTALHAINYFCF